MAILPSRERRGGAWAFAVGFVVAAGCSGDDADSGLPFGGGSAGTAAVEVDSSGDEAASSGDVAPADSSTGADAEDDPSYPRPSPVDEAGTCPDGFFGPITFDGGGWACLPPCTGEPAMCPASGSGDAPAECATNPLSSAAPCTDSSDCTVESEMCGNVGGGAMGCLLPPSHCILRCSEGETCPAGQACAPGPGICQYEA